MFIFSFWNRVSYAQELDLIDTESKVSYAEKVYLQLNSTFFYSEETVWFRAIVTDSYHSPSIISGILHVELIDFNQTIIAHKLLKLKDGLSDGYFQLNRKMPAGRYQIRAYTEWNKNFDQGFNFKQYIDVYTQSSNTKETEVLRDIELTEIAPKQFELSLKVYPREINSEYRGKWMMYIKTESKTDSVEIKKNTEQGYDIEYLLPKNTVKAKVTFRPKGIKSRDKYLDLNNVHNKTIIINDKYLDVQFFPEGGKLVDKLWCKIGVKALNYRNKGTHISGHIVDADDKVITTFKSNQLGMGMFNLRSFKDKTYYAVIEDSLDIRYRYPLPKVHEKGLSFTTNTTETYWRIAIKSNYFREANLYLKAESRGTMYHYTNLKMKDSILEAAIYKSGLPAGIVKLTLLDSNNNPICERLVYNHKEKSELRVDAVLDQNTYKQRGKTVLNLSTKDKDHKAISGNLSVLVLNKEQFGDLRNEQGNILSYFLLSSELKGTIENPIHYFKRDNPNRRRDIDALLLTQGWRNYIYNDTDSNDFFEISPESSLSISGVVEEFQDSKKRPKTPIELGFISFSKSPEFITQRLDSTGSFKFQLDDVYSDELEYLIQFSNANGKKENFTVDIDEHIPPEISFDFGEQLYMADTITSSLIKKRLEDKSAVKASTPFGTIALDEVELTAYNLSPEQQIIHDLHGPPDVIIEDNELHKNVKKWSYGLFSVLRSSYPESVRIIRITGPRSFLLAQAFAADFTFVIIDGIPVRIDDYPLIGKLPTKEIERVEIVKNPKLPSRYVIDVFGNPLALSGTASISFINIYTYSKKGLHGVKKTQGIYRDSAPAFSPKLEFYSPKHANLDSSDWSIPDLRPVVHWEPNVKTDINGTAKVEFYNDDHIGDMLVIVEGITSDGTLGYFETSYSVIEADDR